jgi:hypothetical protein
MEEPGTGKEGQSGGIIGHSVYERWTTYLRAQLIASSAQHRPGFFEARKESARSLLEHAAHNHQRLPPIMPVSLRGRVSPATTESLIYSLQNLNESQVTWHFPATLISWMQALEPSLRLLTVPDRSPQVLQQPAFRPEVWITTHYLCSYLIILCARYIHRSIVVAVGLMRAGSEEIVVLDLVGFRDCSKEKFLHEPFLVLVVSNRVLVGPFTNRLVDLVC